MPVPDAGRARILVSSVHTDASGMPALQAGDYVTPIIRSRSKIGGGWFVTGLTGSSTTWEMPSSTIRITRTCWE